MRLTELKPEWLEPHVFAFLCPCCQKTRLLCKSVPMSMRDQVRIVHAHLKTHPEDDWDWPIDFVPMKESFGWKITGTDFDSLTVTPSIDASAAGHWHGFITNGEIR